MSSKRKRSASPNLTQEAPVERSFSSSSSSWNEAPISQKGKGKAAAPGTIAGTAATPGSTSGSASSTTRTDAPGSSTAMLGDLFTYQEIFLRVLSFLSPGDLAKGQGVNRYWARMTLDPQVSFLTAHPHPLNPTDPTLHCSLSLPLFSLALAGGCVPLLCSNRPRPSLAPHSAASRYDVRTEHVFATLLNVALETNVSR